VKEEHKMTNNEEVPAEEEFNFEKALADMMELGCNDEESCGTFVSQLMIQDPIPEDWLQAMSELSAAGGSCCGAPPKTEED
jgi:hypothetical protein